MSIDTHVYILTQLEREQSPQQQQLFRHVKKQHIYAFSSETGVTTSSTSTYLVRSITRLFSSDL